MKLTVRGEYALRALIVLGQNHHEGVVKIQFISGQQNIPKRFLEQILADLKAGGFVESRRGIDGGYRLRLPPAQITLAKVIRHIEGALAPVNCVSENFYQKCSCPDERQCALRSVMKELRDAIVGYLDGVTVADLCERAERLKNSPSAGLDFMI